MSDTNIKAPDYAAFERLIRNVLREYNGSMKEMETGWDIITLSLGEQEIGAPYVKIVMKDGSEIKTDMQNMKTVRVH